jgi:cytochrome P450
VLTRLIQGEDSGERLSEVELLQNCMFILNAGHETTTNLIGNALVALQEWPDARPELLRKPRRYARADCGRAGGAPDPGGRRVPALRIVQPAGQPACAAGLRGGRCGRCPKARW